MTQPVAAPSTRSVDSSTRNINKSQRIDDYQPCQSLISGMDEAVGCRIANMQSLARLVVEIWRIMHGEAGVVELGKIGKASIR